MSEQNHGYKLLLHSFSSLSYICFIVLCFAYRSVARISFRGKSLANSKSYHMFLSIFFKLYVLNFSLWLADEMIMIQYYIRLVF